MTAELAAIGNEVSALSVQHVPIQCNIIIVLAVIGNEMSVLSVQHVPMQFYTILRQHACVRVCRASLCGKKVLKVLR